MGANKKIRFKCLGILALAGLVFLMLPQASYAMEPIFSVLKNTSSGEGATVLKVWNTLINLANTFVIVVLIAVAFAQILRLNVSTYGIKKMLPTLVFAIIAANFSFLFCRLMIDFSNAILSIFIEGGVGVDKFQEAFNVSIGNASNVTAGKIFWFILGQLFKMAAAVIVLILAFLFLVRNWMLYFLVALAPLCIMAMVLPQSKSLFTQWWSNFTKWVFMPIVSVFWLWLGAQWFDAAFAKEIWLINYVFAGACIYLALTTPFKMGGAIMNQWASLGKKVTGYGYNNLLGGAGSRMSAYGQRLQQRHKGTFLGNVVGKNLERAGGVVNIPASVKAYKAGFAESRKNLESAAKKTNTYNRLLGERARATALLESFKEDYEQKSAGPTGVDQRKTEDAILDDLVKAGPGSRQSRLFAENHKDAAGNKIVVTAANKDSLEVREALRSDIATMNAVKLMDTYEGLGGTNGVNNGEAVARAKLNLRRFNQLKNYATQKNSLTTAYGLPLASSAVGAAAGAAVAAATTAIQQIPEGEAVTEEAKFGGKDFINVKLVGVSDEGRNHLQSAFDTIREAREGSVKKLMDERRPAIEQELTGVGMIIGAGRKGSDRRALQANLNLARELIGRGEIDAFDKANKDSFSSEAKEYFDPKVFSMISGASKSIAGEDRSKKSEALQRRIDDLQAGLDHFKTLATASSDEQREAIGLMKSDPTGQAYIKQTSQRLNQQNEINARAQVAAGMTAENIASNPALQGVNLGSIHTNEDAINKVAQSLEGLSEQMHNLSSGPLSDPHTLTPGGTADKAEFINMAKEVMKAGRDGAINSGGKVQGTLSDRQTRRLFAEELGKATAKSLGKTLSQTPLKVTMTTPKVPPTTTGQTPQTPTETPPASPTPPPEPPKAE